MNKKSGMGYEDKVNPKSLCILYAFFAFWNIFQGINVDMYLGITGLWRSNLLI